MRPIFAPICLALAFAGCVQDADTILEPDPVDVEPGGGPDGAVEQGLPAIVLEPPFVALDGAGALAELTVRNGGDAPLRLSRISRRGDSGFAALHAGRNALLLDADAFGGEDGLAPGEEVVLTIEALVGPPASAVLVIESDDPERPAVEVPVGFPDVPCLRALPEALDFGGVVLGDTTARGLEVENCGEVPVTVRQIVLRADSDIAFSLSSVPALETIIEPGAVMPLELAYAPRVEAPATGTLLVHAEGTTLGVPLIGSGRGAACPEARVAQAESRAEIGDVLVLDGSLSVDSDGPDGLPLTWSWVVVSRPNGSTAEPFEAFHDPARPDSGGLADDMRTPTAVFHVDAVGVYAFELVVEDATGCVDRTRLVVEVCPCDGDGLRAVLDWQGRGENVPEGSGSDLDLHLLHPNADNWFSRPYDCHYAEPTPDWSRLDDHSDDPRLIADRVGEGPEIIELPVLEDTELLGAPYLVGVHFNGIRGADAADVPPRPTARLRLFVDGVLRFDMARELGDDQLWDVVEIHGPAVEIRLRDRLYDQRP